MRALRTLPILIGAMSLLIGCSSEESTPETGQTAAGGAKVSYQAPESTPVPEKITPKNDTDWAAKVNNKNAEVVELLNILTPVAGYLTAAFEQYGDKFSEGTHEEWDDTVAQLNKATTLYGDCQKRMEAKKFNKKLFLDLEESWQILVKVGVAGLRTKSMVGDELTKL